MCCAASPNSSSNGSKAGPKDGTFPWWTHPGGAGVTSSSTLTSRARSRTAIGDKATNRWHLQIGDRWVTQYNVHINDRDWGRMFVRMCPYLPFSARVCLNQHHWLATQMQAEGITFRQCSNAFVGCSHPTRLQELADSLKPQHLIACGQKWLAHLTPFFTARERAQAGCQHRLFFA